MWAQMILCINYGLLYIVKFNFDSIIYVVNPKIEESMAQARSDLLFLTSEEEMRHANYSIILIYPQYSVPSEYVKVSKQYKI